MERIIPRSARRGGVLENTFQAPLRVCSDVMLPASYSKIVGTPICLGENDIHSSCVPTAAYNCIANSNARKGIFAPFAEELPFDLYVTLGGMPADVGLDPAVLFEYWQNNKIAGYGLKSIEAIALDDQDSIKRAIIDNGFIYMTASLTQSQMTQKVWSPVQEPSIGGHAFTPSWYEGDYLHDFTWGEDIPMTWGFLKAQGLNIWRLDLE